MVTVSLKKEEVDGVMQMINYLNYKRIGTAATELSYTERIQLKNKLNKARWGNK